AHDRGARPDLARPAGGRVTRTAPPPGGRRGSAGQGARPASVELGGHPRRRVDRRGRLMTEEQMPALSNGGGSPLLEVRNLVKHFPITRGIIFQKQIGAVKAVDYISFDVKQGETLGIVGETG